MPSIVIALALGAKAVVEPSGNKSGCDRKAKLMVFWKAMLGVPASRLLFKSSADMTGTGAEYKVAQEVKQVTVVSRFFQDMVFSKELNIIYTYR
jgi:hypothetical protein